MPLPTRSLNDHILPAVCDCLFNIFATILHFGGCSPISNLTTRHALVTGTHLSWKHLNIDNESSISNLPKMNKTYADI